MSYESFRSDFASKLISIVSSEQLNSILNVLDESSTDYEFKLKSTDIIVSDGLPNSVKMYIASKTIQRLTKGSLYNYYSHLCFFFNKVCKPVEDVTAVDVRMYLAWYKTTRNIKNSTLDHIRIILNSFFEWCVDEELLRKNPMRHIEPIRVEEPERLPLTALELEKVRKCCKTLREKALVDLLYSSAARVSEVCALNINDIDFCDHTIRIKCGKGGKGRTSFLNAESEVSLKAYLATRTDDSPALFVPIRGRARHLGKKAIEREIERIVSRCDVSVSVTPHIFRHTAASLALQRGMPIDQVQRFLGHSKIQTTLRYAKALNYDVKVSHQKYVA